MGPKVGHHLKKKNEMKLMNHSNKSSANFNTVNSLQIAICLAFSPTGFQSSTQLSTSILHRATAYLPLQPSNWATRYSMEDSTPLF